MPASSSRRTSKLGQHQPVCLFRSAGRRGRPPRPAPGTRRRRDETARSPCARAAPRRRPRASAPRPRSRSTRARSRARSPSSRVETRRPPGRASARKPRSARPRCWRGGTGVREPWLGVVWGCGESCLHFWACSSGSRTNGSKTRAQRCSTRRTNTASLEHGCGLRAPALVAGFAASRARARRTSSQLADRRSTRLHEIDGRTAFKTQPAAGAC